MLAIHNQLNRQMRNRLKTSVMGLGLLRLLQDAGRIEEASATLYSLENGFQSVAEASDKVSQKPCKANHRRQGVDLLLPLPISGFLGVQNFEPITC